MLEEVFGQLSSDRSDVVVSALKVLLNPASIKENHEVYRSHLGDILRCLPLHLQETSAILTNLLADDKLAQELIDAPLVYKIIIPLMLQDSLSKSSTNLACMLLNNVSVVEKNALTLLQLFQEEKELVPLFRKYFSYNPHEEIDTSVIWDETDIYQHIGSVIVNITTMEEGRRIILKHSNGFLAPLILQIRSRNLTRRRAGVSILKNLLFDSSVHWWFVFESELLTTLLTPLVAPTPFTEKERVGMDVSLWMLAEDPDKQFEPDVETRRMMLECLLLLCQTRVVREQLRARKVYPVIRNLDYAQEDEGVSAIILELVQFLARDESPEEESNNESKTQN